MLTLVKKVDAKLVHYANQSWYKYGNFTLCAKMITRFIGSQPKQATFILWKTKKDKIPDSPFLRRVALKRISRGSCYGAWKFSTSIKNKPKNPRGKLTGEMERWLETNLRHLLSLPLTHHTYTIVDNLYLQIIPYKD